MECKLQSVQPPPPIVNISEGKIQFRNKMFYREKSAPNGTTYWRCVEKQCYGRVNVDIIGEIEERRNQHNCLISEFDCLKEKCKDEIRRYACDNLSIGPLSVITTVKAKYSCDVSNSLPNIDSLCRAIQRWRSPKGIEQHNSRRARDAALEKLKQLTLSAESDMKGIDLVRKVLNEMPSEAKHLMPTEENLRKKVARWAKQGGISLTRSTLNDYIPNEDASTRTTTGADNGAADCSGVENIEQEASCSNPPENESAKPANSGNDANKSGVFFLKGKKVDGHWRVMIKGQIYHWRKGIPGKGKAYYQCREARTGCPVTAVIYEDKQFEISGKHTHKYDKCLPKVKAGRWLLGLKRVDEDGNELGPASMDSIPYREMDGGLSNSNENLRNFPPPVVNHVSGDLIDSTNLLLDDDLNIDLDLYQEPSTNKTMSNVELSKLNDVRIVRTKKPLKSGERCFVCGDELIDSETLDSNTETFRKACCYLNVRSDSNWFPRNPSLGCYSFCDSCTKEIVRIHDLYKKVDEIQSLIFKKVENVEKRIVDAEIIDNWLSDAPHSSVIRFEGFRKQVIINYRNKLKLRREIRLGKKCGTNFVEVQPRSSAHMFASDPSETNAFRKLPTLNVDTRCEPRRRISRAMPKSQRLKLERNLRLNNQPHDSPTLPESPSHDDRPFTDDSDAVSVASEQEIKFWQGDPSKLNVDQSDTLNSNDDADDAWDPEDPSDSDSDYIEDDDDDDEDYELSKKIQSRNNKKPKSSNVKNRCNRAQTKNVKTLPGTSTQKLPAKVSKALSRKPHSHNIEFPDAVVTKDNRIFMQGYEIIKLPPGKYSRRPYSESFSCGTCGKIALNLWKIRQHICGHHLGLFRCPICDKKFSEPRQIIRHIEVKHSERKPKDCEICGRPICGEEQSMKYHIWTHFSEEERNDPQYKSYRPPREKQKNKPKTPNDTSQTFQCCHCGKTFMQPSSLRRHEICHSSSVSKVEKVQCQCCGNFYVHQKALAAHMQRCPATDNVSRRMYPCPKCLMRFKNRGSLNRHLKKHDTHMPYSCPKCPRRFNSKSGFRQHRRICTESVNPRTQTRPSPSSVPLPPSVSSFEETVQAQDAPPVDPQTAYSNFSVPTYFDQSYH